MTTLGMVAAGHPVTVSAAEEILKAGGNAFDAAIGAFFAAAIAEPVLCSLAGGGFLLAKSTRTQPLLYDFFTQTPIKARPRDEVGFYPITADFGTAQQEFHIGMGSTATPGCVRGLFEIHRDLATMPMKELITPALEAAQHQVPLNDFQSYIFSIIKPIYQQHPDAIALFDIDHQQTLRYQKVMADFFEVLAHEGDELFYRGEIAQSIELLSSQHGGHINRNDLESYRSIKRLPLKFNYRDATIFTNPPPSSGGLLIAFTLDLLNQTDPQPFGSNDSLHTFLTAMELTHEARINSHQAPEQILNPDFLQTYRQQFSRAVRSYRGTTHISIIDNDSNVASLTTSNGEGCGYLIPDTGIMLNNMLGEEDLHPQGFNNWPTDQRMTSMMSPSLVIDANHREIVLGSGGSNRIRSAITQVLLNLIDHHMSIEEAVEAPRIHLEKSHLNIEGGYSDVIINSLTQRFPQPTIWNELNLFFGGVHTVMRDGQQFSGHGDPRRGGYAVRI